MRPIHPLLPAVALLSCALAVSGCRTPQSLCQEYVDEINAMLVRCSIPIEYGVVHPSTGERGCHIVQQVSDPRQIVDQCIPWAQSIDTAEECAAVDVSMLPPFCRATLFEIVE
ncbi:MAG: hypothetical protein M3Y87_12225 [Myxococcota bacterium]|nr:hypothetical protein [Myxococcota bacterium]